MSSRHPLRLAGALAVLACSAAADQQELEPNSSINDLIVKTISFNEILTGGLPGAFGGGAANLDDYWRFNATAGVVYDFVATPMNFSPFFPLDIDLAIEDSSGTFVVDATSGLDNQVETLSWLATSSGTFYLIVYEGTAIANTTGTYSIEASNNSVALNPEASVSFGGASVGANGAIDFGSAAKNGPALLGALTVANSGNAPLLTSNLTVSAPFTISEGLDGTINPGASDTFEVSLPTGIVGQFSGPLSFTTNVNSIGTFVIDVSGTISGADTTNPSYLGLVGIVSVVRSKTPSGYEATVVWVQAEDNVTAPENLRYNVYWDSVEANVFSGAPKQAFTGGTLGVVPGLDPTMPFFFGVRAQDEAGNEEKNVKVLEGPIPNNAVMSRVWRMYQ